MFYRLYHFKRIFVFALIITLFLYTLLLRSKISDGEFEPWTALEEFISIAFKIKLPVFLIDESCLKLISEKNIVKQSDIFINNSNKFLSFATTAYFLRSKNVILEAFSSKFDVNIIPSKLTSFKIYNGSENFHFILVHQKSFTLFHIVVFHEFLQRYYFHSQIDENLVDSSQTKYISYGLEHPGIYERKSLRTKEVMIGHLSVYIPLNISQFLKSKNDSSFLLCDFSRAHEFFRIHGQEDNDDFKYFKKKAKYFLKSISEAFYHLGISFWLSSGTCLGWFRQCDLIPYSKDVDIGVWSTNYLPNMIKVIEDHGLVFMQSFGMPNDSYELSFLSDDVKLDIFFFYDTPNYAWNGGTQVDTRKKFKYIFKRFTLCWTIFLDILVKVPCNTEQYVKDNYGDDWFEPVKEWDWKKSPFNVHENGLWPEDKLSEIL